MPELPDIQLYIDALTARIVGAELERIRLVSPFLLRSVDPPIAATHGRTVREIRRIGKRVVLGLEGDYFLVLHLMVGGRLKWQQGQAKVPKKHGLAAFEFTTGFLILTEAGSKKQASLHVVCGEDGLAAHDPGGLEVLECAFAEFAERLTSQNHTLKRSLCDPTLFSGIGNAYSDEILHAARISPFKLTQSLNREETERLWEATRKTLLQWVERLRLEAGTSFPSKVTAFRSEMAVHGKFGEPCLVWDTGPTYRLC